MAAKPEIKKPAQTFRNGAIQAAVWENTGRDGTFYSVTFSRSYKDIEDSWRNTTSFNASDLESLANVAFQARLFIMKNK
ncbi:MAG: uncharacterized protein K0S45_3783 [Nitrospira sp.]|jgi:hypothetical protein|nr:uncharacterized protein [Nitrospira sp.]